jgi:hypothetical protein
MLYKVTRDKLATPLDISAPYDGKRYYTVRARSASEATIKVPQSWIDGVTALTEPLQDTCRPIAAPTLPVERPASPAGPMPRGPLARSAARILELVETALLKATRRDKYLRIPRDEAEEIFALADDLSSKLADDC